MTRTEKMSTAATLAIPLLLAVSVVAQFPNEYMVPGPPRRVTVKTEPTRATLWWEPPGDLAVLVRGYAIGYGVGTPSRKIVIDGAHVTSYTLTGLAPNTSYVFSVNAYNEAEGEDGERVFVAGTTKPEQEAVKEALWAPIGVRAVARQHGIDVSWDDPNEHHNRVKQVKSPHRHYLISYGAHQSEKMHKIRSNARTVRITNVAPNTEYEIAVKVIDEEGRESAWSIRDVVATPKEPGRNISQFDWSCDFEKDDCGLASMEEGIKWHRERNEHIKPFRGTVVVSSLDEKTSSVGVLLRADVRKLRRGGKWSHFRLPLSRQLHPFRVIIEFSWSSEGAWLALDQLHLSSGVCPQDDNATRYPPFTDSEKEIDLLVPLEAALSTDPRVFRARGIDGLPAIGLQRGVEVAVPYRLYLPRHFFSSFSLLVSVKPSDRRGGFLFAVVNPFDTVVDVGLLLEPAGDGKTNISLCLTDSRIETATRVVASFIVPEFVQQWAQFALQVTPKEVVLYFKCVRFASRQVSNIPEQLLMDDTHKLYMGSAGPIMNAGFEVRE